MAYTTRDKVEAVIPAQFLERGMLKDGFEEANVFERIIDIAEREIDGYLAARYSVPFSTPVPGMIVNAALVLSCDLIYRRNGATGQMNPWEDAARRVREELQAIADGVATLGSFTKPIQSMSDVTLIFDRV